MSDGSLEILKSVRPDLFTLDGINCIYSNVIHCLFNCSLKAVPNKSSSFKANHWWNSETQKAKSESVESHKLWTSAGKPKTGNLFIAKQGAKKKYKSVILKNKTDSRLHLSKKSSKNFAIC